MPPENHTEHIPVLHASVTFPPDMYSPQNAELRANYPNRFIHPFPVRVPANPTHPHLQQVLYKIPGYKYPHTLDWLARYSIADEAKMIKSFEDLRVKSFVEELLDREMQWPTAASFASSFVGGEVAGQNEWGGWLDYVSDLTVMGFEWVVRRMRLPVPLLSAFRPGGPGPNSSTAVSIRDAPIPVLETHPNEPTNVPDDLRRQQLHPFAQSYHQQSAPTLISAVNQASNTIVGKDRREQSSSPEPLPRRNLRPSRSRLPARPSRPNTLRPKRKTNRTPPPPPSPTEAGSDTEPDTDTEDYLNSSTYRNNPWPKLRPIQGNPYVLLAPQGGSAGPVTGAFETELMAKAGLMVPPAYVWTTEYEVGGAIPPKGVLIEWVVDRWVVRMDLGKNSSKLPATVPPKARNLFQLHYEQTIKMSDSSDESQTKQLGNRHGGGNTDTKGKGKQKLPTIIPTPPTSMVMPSWKEHNDYDRGPSPDYPGKPPLPEGKLDYIVRIPSKPAVENPTNPNDFYGRAPRDHNPVLEDSAPVSRSRSSRTQPLNNRRTASQIWKRRAKAREIMKDTKRRG